ncbi:MAG: Sigma 54 modulation protein / S30EA ribosomal protein [Betaproteobacteria bacterium ADurb.Bin341]|nr:MAG: Sigma 54 modulation protein / S30EA ribosomal protein [Betaproteobacteria bacterium ADurb.Bin341]
MQIRLNTDESVTGSEGLAHHAEDLVRKTLDHFAGQITRVEVHLSDVNGARVGERDKRCMMEARVAGLQPIAVSEQADSVHQALDGAAHKLRRSLESVLGKLADRKRHPTPTHEDS